MCLSKKIFVLICSCFLLSNAVHPNDGLNMYQVIEKSGFSYEKHHITSDDGYILETIRLLSPLKNASNYPVFFAHGLTTHAIEYVSRGPKYGLGFILSNLGYDVWMLNNRGTDYSKNHTTLDPKKDAKFWEFSMHETSFYDFPAVIDYVLDLTGFDKISIIGHSLGGTNALAFLAARPEYNAKVKIVLSMTGPGIMRHTPSPLVRVAAAYEEYFAKIFNRLGIYELNLHANLINDLFKILSDEEFGLSNTFKDILFMTEVLAAVNFDLDKLVLLTSQWPKGGSWTQIMHYLQMINTGKFKAYDYHNETKNLEHYGTEEAPLYDLRKITTTFVMYYSNADFFVREKDTRLMCKLIKNGIPVEVKVPYFGHVDFIMARNIMEVLYNDMIERLNNAQ